MGRNPYIFARQESVRRCVVGTSPEKSSRYDESSPSRVVGLRVSSAGISFRNNLQPLLGLTYLLRSR